MKNTLIVIDMQKDFIDGSLGTKEAVGIVENVKAKIEEYKSAGKEIIYTRDTHFDDTYMDSFEGRHLPVKHCIKDTEGWQIYEGLYVEGSKVIDKLTFGYVPWNEFDFIDVEICGLCTDICVVSNALIIRANNPEMDILVDASCCAGVTPEKHEAALEVMRSCQIEVI